MAEPPLKGFFFVALLLYTVDLVFRSGLGFGETAIPAVTPLLLAGYIFLAVWAAFGVFKADDPEHRLRNLGRFLIFSAIATFAPHIANLLYKLLPSLATHFIFLLLLAFLNQIWLWYIFATHGESLGKVFYWMFILYICFLIIAAIYATNLASQLSTLDIASGKGIGQQQLFKDLYTKVLDALTRIVQSVGKTWRTGGEKINETLSYASGDYYTGQVDRKATVLNKIELKEIKATQPAFRDIDPVTVFTTLATETLDTSLGTATIACGAANDGSKGMRHYNATPVPAEITLTPYDSLDISCTFDAGTFKTPETRSATINISASFGFTTQAYLKTYWMEKQRLIEMRRNEKDPLAEYNIQDKNPIAVYTNGPLKVGMNIASKGIQGIDRGAPSQDLTLGVTLDNNWQGRLVSLGNLIILTPKGMRVTGVVGQKTPPRQTTCNDPLLKNDTSCDDAVSNIYITEPQNADLSKFLTLLFMVRVDAGDYDKILKAPITTHFFKMTTSYSYVLFKSMTVPITSTTQQATQTGTTESLPATIVGTPATSATANSATITYTTNIPTKDKITYYATTGDGTFMDAYEDNYQSKDATTSHTVNINGLSSATAFRYKIISLNTAGISAVNQEPTYGFTTP